MNKKIRNATPIEYSNIQFKSQLEKVVYKTLLEAGFEPKYEANRFTIWEGVRPTVPFYNRNKSKELVLDDTKLRDITYTPDFTFMYNNLFVIIEAKGYSNDNFPIKKKLFRKYLESLNIPCIYLEVHTKKNLLQAIEIIKSYDTEKLKGNKSTDN